MYAFVFGRLDLLRTPVKLPISTTRLMLGCWEVASQIRSVPLVAGVGRSVAYDSGAEVEGNGEARWRDSSHECEEKTVL